MRLVTFQAPGDSTERLGAFADDDEVVVDLTQAGGGRPELGSMLALIEAGPEATALARRTLETAGRDDVRATGDVRLLAPLTRPRRLRDLSVVQAHLYDAFKEMARRMAGPDEADIEAEHARLVRRFALDRTPKRPTGTLRDHAYISGPDDVVTAPGYSSELDYELELGMVVGRTARGVSEDEAASCIFGFTIYNDWTARDRQVRNHRIGAGLNEDAKDFDFSNGLGPCIVTADEIADPNDLVGTVRVDGVEWSRGSSNEATFTWEQTVAAMSEHRGIVAGEVWGSGTFRSGSAFEQGRTLPADCLVELEVESIGVLRNRAVTPAR